MERKCAPITPEKVITGVLLGVILLLSSSNGYPRFRQRIPNGENVPNPCNRSTIWPGVGHQNIYGSGPRNPFGLDFQANNYTWNQTLCMKDSDGDGRKNGEELGDPNCVWTPGTIPTNTAYITHPGVCEPLDSHDCLMKNSWFNGCSPKTFDCPALNDSAVTNFTLRFPETTIPAIETTYICHTFELPANSTSDIIAYEAVVDNAEILHHMLVFGCTGPPDHAIGSTFLCGMVATPPCLALIAGWAVGVEGACIYDQVGYRMGPDDFKYAVVQLHWNNPMLHKNLTDASGMRIFRTPNLRPNKGQILIFGQNNLEIPPNQKSVTFTGNCSSGCTTELPHSIFITWTFLHMHTLGKSGEIALYRNGTLFKTLEVVTDYDYNNPRLNILKNVVEVKPGDKISVKCVYSSIGRDSTTFWGEATSSEMCYGFFSYYPLIKGFEFCAQWNTVDQCRVSSDPTDIKSEYCDVPGFMTLLRLSENTCNESCTETTACRGLVNAITDTGCPNNTDVMQFVGGLVMPYDVQLYARCSAMLPPRTTPMPPPSTTPKPCRSPGFAVSASYATIMMLLLICAFAKSL